MVRTEVGYAGGTTAAPTYRNIGDHAEVLQLHFDPSHLPLETLLEMFWNGHDPTTTRSSQYRALLLCANADQLRIARQSASALAKTLGHPVVTPISAGDPFYSAEDYHQKWRLRQKPALFEALRRLFPSEAALLASTAAAKLNAAVGGHAPAEFCDAHGKPLPVDARLVSRALELVAA